MRVFLILGSSSSSASIAGHRFHRSSHFKPPKSSLSNLSPSGAHSPLSSRASTRHSRPPLLSSVQWGIAAASSGGSTPLRYYADMASKLAERGKLEDFAIVVESVVVAGVEPSQFAAVLTVEHVAKGISRCLREGKLWNVVQVLRKVDELGISAVGLCDESAVESLRRDCRRIAKSGEVEELVEFLEVLAGFGFSIRELIKPTEVIKLCVDCRNPKMAIRYASILPHADIMFCTTINEFGKKGDLKSAFMAYTESKAYMNGANMYIYRTIIDVCGLCGNYKKSRNIYQDLLSQNVTPNIYVFNSLMNVNAHDMNYTFQLYKNMQNLGVPADMASYNILLKACCLAGRVDLAQEIYREVKHMETTGVLKLDVFTYSTIVKVFADAKLWKMALKVKEDMQSAGVSPNMVTWSSLISSCANSGLVELAIQLFEEMVSAGCKPNAQCCNILLHACVEARQFDRAFRLFRSWGAKEVWDDMEKYCKNSTNNNLNTDPTSQLCSTNMANVPSHVHQNNFVRDFTFRPTITTYNILMKACGTDYYHAKALMEEMRSVGLIPNHISWSILIDICGGSRDVESAVQILTTMRMAGVDPDVVAYTTAIKVCVEGKNWKLAFSLFEEMKRFEIQPNLVTYSTLLKARSTYGSLHEVQQCLAIYQDMRKSGFKSNDHYLKELIAEWCEGVIQNNNQQQGEINPCNKIDIGKPRGLILEKVAQHLQKSFTESLAIDLQELTKVEARIVVLAVLRMIKENYSLGKSVKDDILIILEVSKVETDLVQQNFEMRDAITKLLQDELGLEVLPAGPTAALDKGTDPESYNISHTKLKEMMGRNTYSTRRPAHVQRLKVTRKSLQNWLQRSR